MLSRKTAVVTYPMLLPRQLSQSDHNNASQGGCTLKAKM